MKVNGRIQLYPMLRVTVFLVAGIVLGVWLRGHVPVCVWHVALIASIVVAAILRGRRAADGGVVRSVRMPWWQSCSA